MPETPNPALIARARINAERLVLPAVIPIYTRPGGSDRATFQSGTGFLVNLDGRPALVTARQTLYGHRFDEDPWTKHIVFNGRVRGLFELATSEIIHAGDDDITALYADELGLARSLPAGFLLPSHVTSELVGICGFLGRDFHRQVIGGLLELQPYWYANVRINVPSGRIGFLYPTKNKNIDARTRKIVQAPRPVGMSGCPMLDAVRLSFGLVRIVGVFTEQKNGRALGEGAPKVIGLLRQLTLRAPAREASAPGSLPLISE